MWSKANYNLKIATLAGILAMIVSCSLQNADAAQMSDYCITPPYVGGAIEPNLLLLIDNSSSMNDLEYTDTSNYYCANAANTTCTQGTTCSGAATCLASSSTTTTTGASTPLYCTTDDDCRPPNPNGVIGDICFTSGAKKNQCKNAKVSTTTVTINPISCTSDNNCKTGTCPASCTAPNCSCTFVSNDTCNNKCSVRHTCFDNTYLDASPYIGYFTGTDTYTYDFANGKFTGGATMPGTCTYSGGTPKYVCVDSSGTPEAVTGFVASGNFLNWLTMSKFDIQKQILTGGKYCANVCTNSATTCCLVDADCPLGGTCTATNSLVAETRGCSGRKFVKVAPEMTGITFAIRGGSTSGIDKITSTATEHGQTHIEIYQGTYNAADCASAVNDWMNVNTTNLGTTQKDTGNCIGASGNASAPLVAYNQTVHDCFWYYNGHGLSNLQVIQKNCVDDWSSIVSAASITNPDAADAVCSSVLTHPNSPVWSSMATGYNLGYLGLCYNGSTGNWDAAGGFDANCSYNEEVDFCASIGAQTPVTDPASDNIIPGTLTSIPGFVMEAGLFALPNIGNLTVRVGLSTPPTNLIDKYKSQIRFGAMTFQTDGSATECNKNGHCSATTTTPCVADAACPSGQKCMFEIPCQKNCSVTVTRNCYLDEECPFGETCDLLASTDGGKIISSVGAGFCSITSGTLCKVDSDCPSLETCTPSVGDHSIGLIKRIDDIKASSWTPFAEAFYNAMGYFARSNSYPVPPATATPTSRDFNFTGLPASLSYVTYINPSQFICQKNNLLLITDGMSTADQNPASEALASAYKSHYGNVSGYDASNSCPRYAGSRSVAGLSWIANNLNIKTLSTSGTSTLPPTNSSERIFTYVVYNGASTSNEPGLCNPLTLMQNTATNGGTSLLSASTPTQLYAAIDAAFKSVSAAAASGTAASVLATGEGSGANLIQAVFYPKRDFYYCSNGTTNNCTPETQITDCGASNKCLSNAITWTGRVSNYWYYVDPKILNSNIREDDGDKILNIKTDLSHHDNIVQMFFDNTLDQTFAHRYADPTGSAVVSSANLISPDVTIESLGNIFEVGTKLWQRNLSTNPRTIYTSCATGAPCISLQSLATFTTAAATVTALRPYLQASSTDEANALIQYTHGLGDTLIVSGATFTYRPRTVKIPSIDTTPRVWKFGDVINSTPKIVSWTQLNNYNKIYGDTTYGQQGTSAKLEDPADPTHFVTTSSYKSRGMIFTGGNDGMLHAFKLGQLQLNWSGQGATEKARLWDLDLATKCSTANPNSCGKEMWAFIPRNALPYLRYMADSGYCHLYSNDLAPVIFDASIGGSSDTADTTRTVDSWRTILIGGMRFGGACRTQGTACNVISGVTGSNCVNTPMLDPANNAKGLGYSVYYALDITDPTTPTLLWEFTDEGLGFASSGPALVRINGQTSGVADKSKNGHWYVVFGSGPTGPIDTGDHQFLGRSDQSLKLFILDLKSGALLRTMDADISIPYAFAGNMTSAALDADRDYQDEIFYVPYTKKAADGTWTNGGVGRVLTNKNPDQNTWLWSKVIDNVGPVTAAPAKLLDVDNQILWVYFGTGRYYFVQPGITDDGTGQRRLFTVKDPCFGGSGFINGCTDSVGSLTDATNPLMAVSETTANGASYHGCFIGLDQSGSFTYAPDPPANFLAERDVTDALATSSGCVYFTTFKPYVDQCLAGGKSFVWSLQHSTCSAGTCGQVMLQQSTGDIGPPPPTPPGEDPRKSGAMEGKSQEDKPSFQDLPAPLKRTMHVRER